MGREGGSLLSPSKCGLYKHAGAVCKMELDSAKQRHNIGQMFSQEPT